MMSSCKPSLKSQKLSKRKHYSSVDCHDKPIGTEELWPIYGKIYDQISENPDDEVPSTEEIISNTRFLDVVTVKLIDDVQKLELNSVDIWSDIADRLVKGWDTFFGGPDNQSWSIGDLIPLNRCKYNYFVNKSLLLKASNQENKPQSRQKKERLRRKDDSAPAKMAKPLQGLGEEEPALFIEYMKKIKAVLTKICHQDSSISYWKLVLHPSSFSNTVYNIFAVAFLIREGSLALTVGSNDELMVKTISESGSDSSKDTRKKSNFLISLTTTEWQMLVENLRITDPIIPSLNGFIEEDQFCEKFMMSQKKNNKKK